MHKADVSPRGRIHQYIFFVLLMLFALGLPYTMRPGPQWNSMLLGLFLLNWLLEGNFSMKITNLKRKHTWKLWLAYILIQVIGLWYTSNSGEGEKVVMVKLALWVLPLIFLSSSSIGKNQFKWVLRVFVISLFWAGVWVFWEGVDFLFQEEYDLAYIKARLIMHRVYFSMFHAWAIFILIYLMIEARSWLEKLVYLPLLAYMLFMMGVLYVKMSILSLGLSIVFLLILYLWRQKKWMLLGLGMLLFVSGAFYIFYSSSYLQDISRKIWNQEVLAWDTYSFNVANSINIRYVLWNCSFEILSENGHFWWGVGTGDVQDSLNQCYEGKSAYIHSVALNAHSEYFQECLRHGILGLLIYLGALFYPVRRKLRQGAYLFIGFILLFSLSIFTESMMSRQAGVYFLAFFLSLMTHFYHHSSERDQENAIEK